MSKNGSFYELCSVEIFFFLECRIWPYQEYDSGYNIKQSDGED